MGIQTGSETFLAKTLVQNKPPSFRIDGMTVTKDVLDCFDIDEIDLAALFFQPGYLTISSVVDEIGEHLYVLG